MAEVLIKAGPADGEIINVGFDSAKSEIRIKIQKKKDKADNHEDKSSEN
jgi:hypothetical protein